MHIIENYKIAFFSILALFSVNKIYGEDNVRNLFTSLWDVAAVIQNFFLFSACATSNISIQITQTDPEVKDLYCNMSSYT